MGRKRVFRDIRDSLAFKPKLQRFRSGRQDILKITELICRDIESPTQKIELFLRFC
uniref:Uncharacterized protein n=1 Tax=Romanomermis culicivorax TaxID=13658 RepID=A0A915K353_ROMCU